MKKNRYINDKKDQINSSKQFQILFDTYVKAIRDKLKKVKFESAKDTDD